MHRIRKTHGAGSHSAVTLGTVAIKEVAKRKNAAETVLMLKTAYKDDAMGKTQVYEWFSRFNGDMSIDDKRRSGRPSTARNDENVEKIIPM
ncbi:hypothetical protein NQ318_008001 [Aromia moschata]|uniref:Mos1 transposase HTH domain-containing protein n=1 Tax=Aromia moschata TaxID=1265417 RepID=A0AAV8XU71_9CUCU|nr:hypothetical protein NQ318_008001 [Aromia moschata]